MSEVERGGSADERKRERETERERERETKRERKEGGSQLAMLLAAAADMTDGPAGRVNNSCSGWVAIQYIKLFSSLLLRPLFQWTKKREIADRIQCAILRFFGPHFKHEPLKNLTRSTLFGLYIGPKKD